MKSKLIDLTDQKYGMLTAIEQMGYDNRGRALWRCACECGGERTVRSDKLRAGRAKSCGCQNKGKSRGGITDDNRYVCWTGMNARCRKPTEASYKNYGGRGIEQRFKTFEEFCEAIGPRPSLEHSVDRIDNDGHYEKGNVRWATATEQVANKRKRS